MVKRLLVIDRDDQGDFFLTIDAGVLTLGSQPRKVEAVFRDLHISHIHCEIEVDEDPVVECDPETESSQRPETGRPFSDGRGDGGRRPAHRPTTPN